jgi:hypothetical protein
MVNAKCSPKDGGDVCVRKPDGTWHSLPLGTEPGDPWRYSAGPLLDGRIVVARPRGEGDTKWLELVAVDASGTEEKLARLDGVPTRANLVARFAEMDDGTVTLLLDIERQLVSVAVSPQHVVKVAHLGAGSQGERNGTRAVSVLESGEVRVSSDGGASWSAYPSLPEVSGFAHAARYLNVSEVGMTTSQPDRALFGWGPPTTSSFDRPPIDTSVRNGILPSPTPSLAVIRCDEPAKTKPAKLKAKHDAPKAPVTTIFPPRKDGPKATQSAVNADPRMMSALAPSAALDMTGDASAPTRVTVRYRDPFEARTIEHTATLRASDWSWDDRLQRVATHGAAALLFVQHHDVKHASWQTRLVRIPSRGAPIMTSLTDGLAPSSPGIAQAGDADEKLALPADDKAPVAWITLGAELVVWFPGESPRVIAEVSPAARLALGEPTHDAVPFLVSWSGGAMEKVVPIPAAGTTIPAEDWLTGFQTVRIPDQRVENEPSCGRATSGPRFVTTGEVGVSLPEQRGGSARALVDYRLDGGNACVAAITIAPEIGEERRAYRLDLQTGRSDGETRDGALPGVTCRRDR